MKNSIWLNIFLSIGVGYLFTQLQIILETKFLINFLQNNLITLLVALIAINSATLSIVLTKIRELIDKSESNIDFSNTKKQMILSINEQITLIAVSMIFLMLLDSSFIKNNPDYISLIHTFIIGCFVYAVRVLYDTAKSVFVILDYE